ncbi:hypothetical protein GJ744_002479 [Endocarpon pusillum]|uniref:Uncharacterized protein n=1 Tax=Endocarpon pusillum TaxID=364733 RepID=A0A8H7AFL1_9EURO|nr:hypothetical protein GJ744_002479 [Endocarpon pusillum]
MSLVNWFAEHVGCDMRQYFAQQFIKRCGRSPRSNPNSLKSSRAFLDLPTEIRLLIYEAIFTPASVVLQSGELPAMIAVLRNFPELISRGSRDVQLFRTCRTCYEEASPIFYASLNLLVYQHLPLLRLNFLPRIGPLNASFIKMVTITPIGLPGEHQRLLECLGSKHGGLIGVENLTLEIWEPEHVPAFISTCQELMQRHGKLKILFGRGTDTDCQLQAGDIPATLKLAKPGQSPGHRERIIQSIKVVESTGSQIHLALAEECSRRDSFTAKGRRTVSLAVPPPRRTIWSRYKFRRSQRSKL